MFHVKVEHVRNLVRVDERGGKFDRTHGETTEYFVQRQIAKSSAGVHHRISNHSCLCPRCRCLMPDALPSALRTAVLSVKERR